ncbi:MAG: S8 family serine peptidase [Lachnospiraceae bacterium]|nr:S8 family serine peptidase [Lachnospiraceae bacterium]
MENQKVDNVLNLAVDATPEEREKSLELNVGYNPADRDWDVIIKYSGNIDELRSETVRITPLLNQYAVARIPQSQLDAFANLPQIEYVEKPKRLFFALSQARAVSCINPVQAPPFALHGQGVLVACVDSGIDYGHMDFRNPDGTTRIVSLWDQTIEGAPPEGYFLGTEFTENQINEALGKPSLLERYAVVPSRDLSGHGTAVMGIAAGNGRESGGIQRGIADESRLIVVKLGTPLEESFPRTTELIQGIDFCIRQAIARNQPLALNISFGNSYGSHEGNSLLETYLDQVSGLGRTTICVGMGNEGSSRGHTSINLDSISADRGATAGRMSDESPAGSERPTSIGNAMAVGKISSNNSMITGNRSAKNVEISVGLYQTSFNVQIWKNYVDEIAISIISPGGRSTGTILPELGPQRYRLENTELLIYYGLPNPYSTAQEIYIDFLPADSYVDTGIWNIRFLPGQIVDGLVDLWLPGGNVLNEDTHFYTPTPDRTLTIPAAASGVISVGAYDSRLQSYADFSGRGYTRVTNQVKPDLAAPGVRIQTAKAGGGYGEFTGTSFATPFVTGSAALMMEWGILQRNSPYLYGEAVKANLRRGARRLPGITKWPNPELGYGVLCLKDSLPL